MGGVPSTYRPEFATVKLAEYLEIATDQNVERVKERKEGGKDGEIITYVNDRQVCFPTVEGFGIFLKVSQDTIYEWCKVHSEFAEAIKEIGRKQKQEILYKSASGQYNPLIGKLILSANHGMHERTEQTQVIQIVDLVKAQEEAESVDWEDTTAHLQAIAESET